MNRISGFSSIVLLLGCVSLSVAQSGSISNPVDDENFVSTATIAVLGSVTPAQTNTTYTCAVKIVGRTGQTLDSYGFQVTSDNDLDPISFSHNFDPPGNGWPAGNLTVKLFVTDMEHEVDSVKIIIL